LGVYVEASTVTDTGTVTAFGDGVQLKSASAFDNGGVIVSVICGVSTSASKVSNSGTITGGIYGVKLLNHSTLVNGGSIGGGSVGVLATASTVTNSGTMTGGTFAVELKEDSVLNILSGAVFQGAVTGDGTGYLDLSGSTAGMLNMGGSFSGFEHIAFGSAAWTLGGTTKELAAHQTISGFATGDTIVLENFSARTASFGAAGLVLNGATTLELQGAFSTTSFALTDAGGNTTIALATAASASFITSVGSSGADTLTALGSGVTLNGGPGVDTLIGYAGFGTNFSGTEAGLNHVKLLYFGGADLIDISNLGTAGTSLAYTGSSTAGTLSISASGVGVVDTITFSSGSSLSAALFHISGDGHGGIYIG
jgi:hypothetical protein